jgi:hypothetical protein
MSEISPQQKKDPRKKKKGQGLKRKGGETSVEKLHILRKEKKERIKFTNCWERFYQKKEKKEITISYNAKFDVWPHPYPHIIYIWTTFFSFLTYIHYTILYQT